MARAQRQQASRSKRRTQAPPIARRRSPAPSKTLDLEAVVTPVEMITHEVQSFGKRRLDKLMDASGRLMAVRNVGDATVIQSRFVLDTIEDYLGEAGRLAQIWMQALGQNWGVVRSVGEAVGRDLSVRSGPARAMADLAMTSAVVH